MVESQPRPKSTKEVKRLAGHVARVGQVLSGRYELLELLGHGGMGAVYKAKHLEMDRLVAVKMLLPDVADDPEMHKRFLREAKASAKIIHPNVVQLIDFGQGDEAETYIVMEFLDGIGLDKVIEDYGFVQVNRAVHIFAQICDGVHKAHSKGIVHRDLKPSNIMLVNEEGETDFVKVVDFGLAKALDPTEETQKLTSTGEIFGSPIYMSPEQCLGQQLDPRSDVYALGVLMYECLTGRVPFLGIVVAETIARQMTEQPKPFAEILPGVDLKIPHSLEAVVMKALSKKPHERQSSMLELKEEILEAMLPKNASAKKAIVSRPKPVTNLGYDSEKGEAPLVVSKNLLLAALAFVVVLIGIGVFVGANLSRQAGTAEKNARQAPAAVQQNPSQTAKPVESTTGDPKPVTTQNKIKTDLKKTVTNSIPTQDLAAQAELARKRKARQEALRIARQKKAAETGVVQSHLPSTEKTAAAADSHMSSYRSKHKHDWHDYSYGYEKKESYTHSWSVPLAGSKSQ